MNETAAHILPEERRQRILDILARDGKVVATALSEQFDVSKDTIRRDLRDLDAAGRLKRVHGGALPRSPGAAPYAARQTQHLSAKRALARKAAQLVRDDQVVLIDGGTTPLEVARHLASDLRATVVTTSAPVVTVLAEHATVEVIVVGGRLDKASMTVTGSAVQERLGQVHADLCFLGVCSLHPEIGITTQEFEEAQLKRLMIQHSSEVIAVVTEDKLGTASPFVVSAIQALTHLVTEPSASEEVMTPYLEAGITILHSQHS